MPTNYILTPDGNFVSANELMHSYNIRYIDLDPDEMMHWKYIKRVTLPNGKYRYYYDESELSMLRSSADAASKEAARKANESVLMKESAERHAKNKGQSRGARRLYDAEMEKSNEFAATSKKYASYAKELTKRYRKKRIISFPKRMISKGIVAIANRLDIGHSTTTTTIVNGKVV